MDNQLAASIRQLHEFMQKDPDKLRALLLERPDIAALVLELDAKYKASQSVTEKGFETFYKAVYMRELPEVDKVTVKELVWAFHNKKGVMIEGWRGKGNTTLLTAWAIQRTWSRNFAATSS